MYDAVFSLGSNCEPAHQLRRNDAWHGRGPFDWMVTPFESISKIIDDEGRKLGSSFVSTYNGTKAASADYGCVYFHEFPHTPDGLGFFFNAEIEAACKSKMQHKWTTFNTACHTKQRVLFVRFRHVTDAPGDEFAAGAPFGFSKLNQLSNVIAKKYPSLDFGILFIHDVNDPINADAVLDPRVSTRSLDISQGSSGNGSDEDWDAIYHEFGIIGQSQSAVA
jgi:hypothetical protein